MTSPRKFMGYTLWPVLDDAGQIEYWDVHDLDDELGEGDPVSFGHSTEAAAKVWVRQTVKEDRFIASLDRLSRMGFRP